MAAGPRTPLATKRRQRILAPNSDWTARLTPLTRINCTTDRLSPAPRPLPGLPNFRPREQQGEAPGCTGRWGLVSPLPVYLSSPSWSSWHCLFRESPAKRDILHCSHSELGFPASLALGAPRASRCLQTPSRLWGCFTEGIPIAAASGKGHLGLERQVCLPLGISLPHKKMAEVTRRIPGRDLASGIQRLGYALR